MPNGIADVRDALDDYGRAFEAFKSTNDRRLAEIERKGVADPLTEQKVDRIGDQLDRLETAFKRTGRGSGGAEHKVLDPAAREAKEALLAYLRRGDEAKLLALGESKALSVGSDPDGGYLVTPAMSANVVTTIYESSPVRQIAAVETISSDALELLVDKDQAGAGWVSEAGTRSESTSPELAKVNIPVHEIYAEPRATQKLLDDASIDAETWLGEKVAERFGRLEATAFVAGTGVGQPRGFLTYAAGTTWGQIEQVNSGHATLLQADGLIDLQGALKEGYQANGSWLMLRSTRNAARKLKDGNSQYLWQPGLAQGVPDVLLGRPVYMAADMPAVAAAALAVAYGDFGVAYQIVDRVGIRVLRDPFTAKPYVKFYTTKRVGGDVVNFEAIKLQVISA